MLSPLTNQDSVLRASPQVAGNEHGLILRKHTIQELSPLCFGDGSNVSGKMTDNISILGGVDMAACGQMDGDGTGAALTTPKYQSLAVRCPRATWAKVVGSPLGPY